MDKEQIIAEQIELLREAQKTAAAADKVDMAETIAKLLNALPEKSVKDAPAAVKV